MQFLLYACTTTSHVQKQQIAKNSFVILKNKDTIYAKKIRLSRGFNKIGKVKVIKANGDKLEFGYDEVYQTYNYQNNGSFHVEEMVMISPNNPVSYVLMDVIINEGTIKLYDHDPTNWGNTSFVVSEHYYGYVRTKKEYDKFLSKLKKCTVFRKKFTENPQFSQ